MLSQRSLRLYSFLFILFSIFCSVVVISTIQSSRSFIHSSASVILLFIPSSIIHLCLFFNSSRSLVNISCIFSIFASIFPPRSWIVFTIIILISFSGKWPISTSFSCFSGILSYPFIWNITFCFFIVINFCNMVSVLAAVRLCFFLLLLSALWWMRLIGLRKLLDGRELWWERLGLALVGRALLSKALIQLSADRWGCTPSLVVVWPEATQPGGL